MPATDNQDLLGFHPILSADSHVSQTDFADDQSWEIYCDPQAPLSILAETSFGLRAKMAQVFPVLLDANNLPFRDPPPRLILETILPDLVIYRVKLFSDMDVQLTLSVPNSQTLRGMFTMKMIGSKERRIRAGVMVRLLPIQNGQIMSLQQVDERLILTGKTEDLFPVCVVAGLPRGVHRPQPGLLVDMTVMPDHPVHVRWAISSQKSKLQSMDTAIRSIQSMQIPMIQRSIRDHEMSGLHIQTGNPEWNDAFQLADIQSRRLILSRNEILPFPTAVDHRQPDTGFSSRGDGMDYSPELQGVSAWECYYAVHNFYLPGKSGDATGLFSNFIQVQQGYGNIDYRPGLGGYVSHILAPPILATTLAEIYQSTQNLTLVRDSYPILVYFVERWIDSDHDRDSDHLPEWSHILQTGWEENPLFNRWSTNTRPVPVELVETPALGAILYRELCALEGLARLLDKPRDALRFRDLADQTAEQVKSLWDRRRKIYRYRDRDTHDVPSGDQLIAEKGNGIFHIDHKFTPPQRLILLLHTHSSQDVPYDFRCIGKDKEGQHIVERIGVKQSASGVNRQVFTSIHHFSQLDQISISGLADDDRWSIHLMDLQQTDLTNFLPLWAGIPGKADASALVTKRLAPYWIEAFSAGLPMLPIQNLSARKGGQTNLVHPLFQSMILDGLLHYGYQKETSTLVNGMMEAIIKNVRLTGAFSQSMDAVTGKPFGFVNTIHSLPPIGMFLRSLGLDICSPDRITVWGINSYPWDVEINFRGTRIFRGEKEVEIAFQDGQTIHLTGTEKQSVSWKTGQGGL